MGFCSFSNGCCIFALRSRAVCCLGVWLCVIPLGVCFLSGFVTCGWLWWGGSAEWFLFEGWVWGV